MSFIFSTAPASTEIYTLSLHDALPISGRRPARQRAARARPRAARHAQPALACLPARLCGPDRIPRRGPGQLLELARPHVDRKSTRLNSSHTVISYAVFCLKKKKTLNTK